jgi:hypothetical protein
MPMVNVSAIVMTKAYMNKCAKCEADLSSMSYGNSLSHIKKCEGGQKIMEAYFS